jgi:hypothetical protein
MANISMNSEASRATLIQRVKVQQKVRQPQRAALTYDDW